MMKKKKRKFSKKYKDEVVKLILEGSKTQTQVCNGLGLASSLVSAWVRQAKADQGENGDGILTSPERRELAELRKAMRELRIERDILREATDFFRKYST